jgi:hypothetical protein
VGETEKDTSNEDETVKTFQRFPNNFNNFHIRIFYSNVMQASASEGFFTLRMVNIER